MRNSGEAMKQDITDEKLQIKNNQLGLASEAVASTNEDGGTKIILCCSCGGGGGSAKIKEEKDIEL